MNHKSIIGCGIIASLYFVLCTVFSPLSFGPIQIRIATVLVMAVCENKKIWAGVLIGVALANFFSPLGIIDVAFGLVGSGVGLFFAIKFQDKLKTIVIYPIATGIIVGAEISMIYSVPYIYSVASVFFGNLISCVIGAFILKSKTIRDIVNNF